MTAAIVPFRRSAQRQVDEALAALQAETLRQTRRLVAECWELRAEAERVRRGYVERRARIEVLLAGIEASAAREEGR